VPLGPRYEPMAVTSSVGRLFRLGILSRFGDFLTCLCVSTPYTSFRACCSSSCDHGTVVDWGMIRETSIIRSISSI